MTDDTPPVLYISADTSDLTTEDRLTAILRRAHDAMSRREPDGISTAAWDQLLQDIEKEIGT